MDFPADPPSRVQMKTTTSQVADALGLSSDAIVNIEVSNSKLCGYAVVEISQDVDIASLRVDSLKLVRPFKM